MEQSSSTHFRLIEIRSAIRLMEQGNLLIENVIIAGRLKCCGMEDRSVVAYGFLKTEKLICGKEKENLWRIAACLPPLFNEDISSKKEQYKI